MMTDKQLKNYWNKVDKRGDDECWNWTAAVDKDGYGVQKITKPRRMVKAHRVSAFINNLIPCINSVLSNDLVLHKCDNPACQNPKHYFIGTHDDNNKDMVSKKRNKTLIGELRKDTKVTDLEIIEIKEKYLSGNIFQRELSSIYGVSQSQISRILNGARRKYVGV